MEFLFFWLATIIVSFIFVIILVLRIYANVADAGYKLNLENLSQESNDKNPILILFMPIINIMFIFKLILQYNNESAFLLDSFNVLGCLEEMTELEKEEYNKKTSGINAILAPYKAEERLNNANKLVYIYDNETSNIFYEYSKNKEIKILKVTGFLSKLTYQEQEQIIKNHLKQNIVNIIKENIKDFRKDIKSNIYKLTYQEYIELTNNNKNGSQ